MEIWSKIVNWFWVNKEWFFSGIGVLVITGVIAGIRYLSKKRKRKSPITETPENKPSILSAFSSVLSTNNLQEHNPYFSGRKTIMEDIVRGFSKSGGNIYLKQTQTIIGSVGVGKTQIALEYAHCYGDRYKDAIWLVRAEKDETAHSDFLDFAVTIGLLVKDSKEARKLTPAQLGNLFKSWFSKHTSWLLILDNVEKEKVIAPYISGIQTGHILITARERELKQGIAINVDPFPDNEAIDFMRCRISKYSDLINDDDDLKKLTIRLGNYPLALEQAAAYIDSTEIPISDYLSMLSKDGLRKTFQRKLANPSNYPHSVLDTLAITLKKLSKNARKLLNLCAYMAPENIPLEFFIEQYKKFPQSLRKVLENTSATQDIIAELLNYSLIKREGNFLNIHRLVQEVIREQADGDTEDWLWLCLSAMTGAMPKWSDFGTREVFNRFEQFASHASAVAEYADDRYKDNKDKEEKTALLCGLLAGGYERLAQYNMALNWHQKSLDIKLKGLGTEHPSTATTYNNMAFIYDNKGDYDKALEWYQKALDIKLKVLGKEHPDTAATYNNMASVYYNQGEYDKALEFYQKSLDICEKVLGKEHPNTATTYNNMASVYDNQGDYDMALEWYQKSLDIRENVLGKEHPDTATTYNNMAGVYDKQGDYDMALEFYQKALDICENVLGKKHPSTIITIDNMQKTYEHCYPNKSFDKWLWEQFGIER